MTVRIQKEYVLTSSSALDVRLTMAGDGEGVHISQDHRSIYVPLADIDEFARYLTEFAAGRGSV